VAQLPGVGLQRRRSRGAGRLDGAHRVAVGADGHTAEHVVVATGAEPFIPPVPGLADLPDLWTNREATGVTHVPRRLIVLGGGAIGVEMSQAMARMGSSVCLIERGDRLLGKEPAAVGEAVAEALRADGIDVRLNIYAAGVEIDGGDHVVTLTDGSHVRGDRVLVAAGRRPRVTGIGLETVGVNPNPRGLDVDERLAIGPNLWAVGDVTGIFQLTHVGEYQGRVVAANILGQPRTANYNAVPRVVYCDPPAASVGTADGTYVATIPLSGVPRTSTYTRAYDTQPGFLSLVSDGNVLVGAYAVGPEAGEWLQQATLAIRARTPLAVLLDVIQPFPTFSEAMLQALRDLERQVGGVTWSDGA
jgi:pyruvate/2-oxoglutarate dehydrogenase complex dihydrolipoamide dehydrogenase (E3) component